MSETIIALCGIVISAIWWHWLSTREARLATPIVSFGSTRMSITSVERKVLFNEYVRQHRWSFVLVWVAVALGGGLGVLFLGRALLGKNPIGVNIFHIVEVAGQISIAGGAFSLYRKSEKQLKQFLEAVLVDQTVVQQKVDGTPSKLEPRY